jgi:chaperonin GroES
MYFEKYKETDMKLKPLDDGVVVKQLEAEDKTTGGIILPDTAKEKPQIGKVVELGPGKLLDNGKRQKISVKKNDKVIYAKYIGSDVEIDNEKYIIMRESDILGIVKD